MNHPRPRRTGLLPSALSLILTVGLTACSRTQPPTLTPPSDTPAILPAETSAPADATLRAYYEGLIAELRQALLEAKQTDYITRLDYETRIAALEAQLEALKNPPDDSPAGTDIPVAGNPVAGDPAPDKDPPPETDTQAPESTPAPTISFHYEAKDGEVTILAYQGNAREVRVPAEITGLPVTRIGDSAFQGADAQSITLPDTVTEIGWFAFADCPSLTTVTLPASVTKISYGAFDGSPRVTIQCPQNSYAEAYAKSFALPVNTAP